MSKTWTVLAAVLMTALTTLLGMARPACAERDVPFKGQAAMAIVRAEPTSEGVRLLVKGGGEATHLGQFTREERLTLHPDGTLRGTLTFVAAHGDRLYATVSGGFTSPTTAEGVCTFTGGTGRFRKASGRYAWVGVTTDGVRFSIGFEGTISY